MTKKQFVSERVVIFQNVHTLVKQIYLGNHTYCSYSFSVNLSSQLQSFRVGRVFSGLRYCDYYTISIANIPLYHLSYQLLDIFRLVSNWILSYRLNTFTIPGKSTSKRFKTLGEWNLILKGAQLIPLFPPHALSV